MNLEKIEKTLLYVKILDIFYCFLYSLVILIMIGLVIFAPNMWGRTFLDIQSDPDLFVKVVFLSTMCFMFFLGLFLFFYHFYLILKLKERSKKIWTLHLISICLGMTSIITMPFSIYLIIKWMEPELKAYYNFS